MPLATAGLAMTASWTETRLMLTTLATLMLADSSSSGTSACAMTQCVECGMFADLTAGQQDSH
jgi:hypothetical protein